MSVAYDSNSNNRRDTLIPPLTATSLYWRVYIYCDDFLKKQTNIPLKYHDISSRFFATLWKDCFQNKIDANRRKYCFPINYTIIANNTLFEINKHIDLEIQMFLYDQKIADVNEKMANVMRLGQISLQAKELILLSKSGDMQSPPTFNDNADHNRNATSVA